VSGIHVLWGAYEMVAGYEAKGCRMSRRVLRGFTPAQFTTLRKGSKMAMGELARLSGVTASTIYAWENGTYTPQVDKLAAVMKVLDTPIEHVVIVPRDRRHPGDWRVLQGWTQPQLAVMAGIATTTLKRIERGEVTLTNQKAETLSRLLKTTVEEYRAAWQRVHDRPQGAPA